MARYLITSALPYINGMKHLANLVGSLLPADIYARFLRAEGEEVLFICATDDHGTPAEIAAQEQGLDVREYCRVQHERQYEVYRCFGLSFDHFGRTSSPQNRELTQYFYRKLDEHDRRAAGRADLLRPRPSLLARPLCDRYLSRLRL